MNISYCFQQSFRLGYTGPVHCASQGAEHLSYHLILTNSACELCVPVVCTHEVFSPKRSNSRRMTFNSSGRAYCSEHPLLHVADTLKLLFLFSSAFLSHDISNLHHKLYELLSVWMTKSLFIYKLKFFFRPISQKRMSMGYCFSKHEYIWRSSNAHTIKTLPFLCCCTMLVMVSKRSSFLQFCLTLLPSVRLQDSIAVSTVWK